MSVIWRRHYSPNKPLAMPRHSSEEWEQHREQIVALYSEYELPRVVSIMEEREGFVASVPQYKRKFRDWGITKYDKYSIKQLRFMYLQLINRFRQGKQDTAFKLNGQVVNSSKVERTLQRALDNEAFEVRVSSPEKAVDGSPCGISPFTPPEAAGVKLVLKDNDRRYADSIIQRAFAPSKPQTPSSHLQKSSSPSLCRAQYSQPHHPCSYSSITQELKKHVHETHPYGDRFSVSIIALPSSRQLLLLKCKDCLEHDEVTISLTPNTPLSSDHNLLAIWSYLLDKFEKEHIFTAPHQYKVFNRMFPPSCEEKSGPTILRGSEGRQDVRLVRCELLASSCVPNSSTYLRRDSPRDVAPLSIHDILMDSLWEEEDKF